MYDSLYDSVDDATKQRVEKTFATKVKFVIPHVQKQKGYKVCGLFSIEVAIGPVTGHVLQSYRSGCHVKLNLEACAQYYKQSRRNQVMKIFVFVYSNPFLLSHIIEIHRATKVK